MNISIDIGGTTTRVASSRDLNTLDRIEKFPTQHSLKEQRALLSEAIREVSNYEKIDALCAAVPGRIDRVNQKLFRIPHIPYMSNTTFSDLFDKDLNCKRYIIENDAALAGLGEAAFGAGKNYPTIAYLTISTGVGGIRISNKELDLTQPYCEPGHHIIDIGGPLDANVGIQGTLETYTAGSYFEKNYSIDPRECSDTAIWHDYGQKLAAGLLNICAFWAPDAIVIGGGLSNQYDMFIESTKDAFLTQEFFPLPELFRIELGDDAGLYGGIALINQLNKI